MSYKNKSEEYVANLCEKSFLSLWSYANPRGKNGKELCDILVVFEPYILIFSVKKRMLAKNSVSEAEFGRWYKKAIKKSFGQIYGAERWLKSAENVIKNDGEDGLPLPELDSRNILRIAIALGGEDKVFIPFGDFGKGFIHVFDEISLNIVMSELDTITDFINYLNFKEDLCKKCDVSLMGGEENLLAYYLQDIDELPDKATNLVISENLWENLVERIEYKNKKSSDKISFFWDAMIEQLINDLKLGNVEFGERLDEFEIALRGLATESRFNRRLLSNNFTEIISQIETKKIRSRIYSSESGIVYVFLICGHDEAREMRRAELINRCVVARGLNQDSNTVIGIATEEYDKNKGPSIDLCHVLIVKWSDEDQSSIDDIQSKFGYFKNVRRTLINEEEYPNS